MKIGITFFRSKMDLWCISKVLSIFWTFSKFGLEERRSRGHVACSPSAREVSRCGALGPGALGELREGFSGHGPVVTRGGLGSIRGVLPAGYSGTRVVLAGLSDVVYGLGTRGQVAFSATSGGSLLRGTRGQVSHSEASGEVLLAGLATHSGASGRLAAHSELPGRCHSRARDALGSFREACGALGASGDTWRIRGLPGIITRGLHGTLGDFRRGWRRRHSGHVAFSERLRRRFRRRLRRGHSVGLRDGSERIRDTRRAPKGSERGGVLRGGCRRGFGRDLRERLREGSGTSLRRRGRRGLSVESQWAAG